MKDVLYGIIDVVSQNHSIHLYKSSLSVISDQETHHSIFNLTHACIVVMACTLNPRFSLLIWTKDITSSNLKNYYNFGDFVPSLFEPKCIRLI